MSSPKVAFEIGRRLGEMVEVEKKRGLESHNLFMQVKVALPLSKPLRRGGFIGGSDGQRSWVDYKYERLPLFCHYRGLLGHDLKHCVEYFARCRNGEEVFYQYREWLKPTSGRSRSPPRKASTTTSQQPNVEQVVTEGTDAHDGLFSSEMTAERNRFTKENPNVEESHALGNNTRSGTSTGCTACVTESEGSVTDCMGPINSVNNTQDRNFSGVNGSHDVAIHHADVMKLLSDEGHVGNKEQVRPQVLKTKHTWTKVTRMEVGLRTEVKETSPIKLGKRGMEEDQSEQDTEAEKRVGNVGNSKKKL